MEKKQYTTLEHYVPICYLKQFAIVENEEYFSYCFFKNTKKLKKINIKKICAVNDLYEFEMSDGYIDRNDIEDNFMDIESQYANFCINVLLDINPFEPIELSSNQLELIKDFCALLVFRSKYMIEDLIRFCRVFAKYNPLDCSKIRKDLNDVEPEIIEEMIIPYANDCYIYGMAFGLMKTMLDTKNLSPEVQSLKDVLGSNYCFLYDKQGRFVTSDTPLINIHNKLIPDLSTVDYICLPLTSS
jgi:hypothetical protein